ncbi:helix-turn-helix domain-containing protein [Arthrobacter pigmenti]
MSTDFTLIQLCHFAAVARTENMSEAAGELQISQLEACDKAPPPTYTLLY